MGEAQEPYRAVLLNPAGSNSRAPDHGRRGSDDERDRYYHGGHVASLNNR